LAACTWMAEERGVEAASEEEACCWFMMKRQHTKPWPCVSSYLRDRGYLCACAGCECACAHVFVCLHVCLCAYACVCGYLCV
jgi:hypothetical protein